jgi:hypothetical protein
MDYSNKLHEIITRISPIIAVELISFYILPYALQHFTPIKNKLFSMSTPSTNNNSDPQEDKKILENFIQELSPILPIPIEKITIQPIDDPMNSKCQTLANDTAILYLSPLSTKNDNDFVIYHEIGHLRKNFANLEATRRFKKYKDRQYRIRMNLLGISASLLFLDKPMLSCATTLLAFYIKYAHAHANQLLEIDADLFACSHVLNLKDGQQKIQNCCNMLKKPLEIGPVSHPPCDYRIKYIQEHTNNPTHIPQPKITLKALIASTY